MERTMSTHPTSPRPVAEQILWLRGREIETTPMHVLKLVYLCHGWCLGFTGEALISEPVEAWTYGPVVPTVYHLYKSFRGEHNTVARVDRSENFENDQRDLIASVVDAYSSYTAIELSSITHQEDTPWDITRRKYGIGAIIPNELIESHYKKRIESDGASA